MRLSGSNSAESAILGNDFRDVVLWKNPEIGSGYSNSGKIAGFDDTLTTRVIIQEPSETGDLSELQNLSDTSDSIIVVGEDSNIAAEVNNRRITIDQNKVTGNFRATDIRRPFNEDEILLGKDFICKFSNIYHNVRDNITKAKDKCVASL